MPIFTLLIALLVPAAAFASGGHVDVPVYGLTPFVLMLAAIAVFPLVAEHWWEHNRNKFIVAGLLGAPVGVWFLMVDPGHVASVALEYVSFLALLGSLFVISGGILLRGDLKATPATNTAFLGLGAVLASVMGTTGAAMLLIRPVLKTNSERTFRVHTVVFFIFVVANCGGLLTPLGDPPLFMGYLRGVPFTWTLGLWKEWVLVNTALLAIYYLWDSRKWAAEPPAAKRLDQERVEPLSIVGAINFPLLIGVVLTVAFGTSLPVFVDTGHATFGVRELAMLGLAAASLAITPKAAREGNAFSFGPIIEVAVLFFGIFLTMIPALVYLQGHGPSLGLTTPAQYFWTTGTLSSFLDNAPTYIVFLELAKVSVPDPAGVVGVPNDILVAISTGAVFMGANTYIGNGPNFMVKAIAESSGVKMPSFFGYVAYAVCILIPLFGLCTLLFFR